MKHLRTTILIFSCAISILGICQQPYFQAFDVEDGLASSTVYDIHQSREGFLWFGTEAGVSVFDGIHFRNLSKDQGLADNEVFKIYEDSVGRLWFFPFNGKLSYYQNARAYNAQNDHRLSNLSITGYYTNCIENDTILFIGSTKNSLIIIKGNQFQRLVLPVSPSNLIAFENDTLYYSYRGTSIAQRLLSDQDSFAIGGSRVVGPFRAKPVNKIHFQHYNATDSLIDHEGNLWYTTLGSGVFMHTNNDVFYLDKSVGLHDDRIYSITSNSDGLIAGYQDGTIDIIKDDTILHDRLTDVQYNRVLKLYSDQEVWVATDKGLFTGSEHEHFGGFKEKLGAVKCLDYSKSHIFVGTYKGLFKIDKNTKEVEKIYHKRTISVCSQQKDTTWIGTNQGLLYYTADSIYSAKLWHEDLSSRIKGITYLDDHTIAFGTHGDGLLIKHGGRFYSFGKDDGLSSGICNVLYRQNAETLWLGTNSGLNQIIFANGNYSNPVVHIFNKENGLVSNYIHDISTKKEIVFVGTDKGISLFSVANTDHYDPPRVYLTRFTINNRDTSLVDHIKLRYDQNKLEFSFSAIAFKSGQNTKFKHRLIGLDKQWIYSSLQSVNYEALRPGRYRFEVKAIDVEHEESAFPAIIEFTITPPFWQTKFFLISSALVILFALFFIVRAIIRYNHRKDLAEKNQALEEKNQIIEKAKKRSEELLLNILPESTAQELITKGSVTAKLHEEVAVFFSDFKGFTTIAEQMEPEQVVSELDYCFKHFDEIISARKIEKIKTIGDAYMCATGLTANNTNDINDMVLASLEIMKFMDNYKSERISEGLPFFEMRIGLHVGHVVSGVVGSKKFAYDIWGDTVNIASRMESSGEPGKINVSSEVFEKVQHHFKCVKRGRVQAKGKGELEMYFIEGLATATA